jgi:uncharacterized protein YcbK (DUF882 family)
MGYMDFHGHRQGSAKPYSLAVHGADFVLGDHFVLMEMASRDGSDRVLVHPALIALLERVREHFDAPVSINSGYRTPRHNRRIGGVADSRHVWGMASDIVVRGVSPKKVADYVETLNPGGLGRYDHFTHVDVEGEDRRWRV